VSHPTLPFSLAIRQFVPNSHLHMLKQAGEGAMPAATQGVGTQVVMNQAPEKGSMSQRVASAVIEILPTMKPAGQPASSLGTWLVSEALRQSQTFTYAGKTWSVAIRPVRYYKPYSVTLKNFTHEVYPGTQIPKNFSSAVLLKDPERGAERDVLIYMNHPLRYRGDTFYQSGFDDNDTTSILQVVNNPGAVTPYVACIVVGVGLLVQFSMHLVRFSRRVRNTSVS
jgi:hypothetical protein